MPEIDLPFEAPGPGVWTTDSYHTPRPVSPLYAALEAVLEEVQQNLGGHDPAHPMLRETVERAGADLAELREHAAVLIGHVDAPEPDAEVLQNLRPLVHDSQPER